MPLNGSLVNVDASHYSGSAFTSTVDPRSVNVNAMPAPGSNVQSAASYLPCQKGGKKSKNKNRINRKKINKISRMYKMKGSRKSIRRRVRRMKSRVRSKYSAHNRSRYATRKNSRGRRRGQGQGQGQSLMQTGGYGQYQNNMPMTQTFSTGGNLSPSLSALASPVPYQVLSNTGQCADNYSRFTNSGFPSRN
jgi:hypothetical protein